MADSPTTRTLKLYRAAGYQCQVVEHWNQHAFIRVDLFGVVDVLALAGPRTIALQATSGAGHSARVKKVCAEPRVFGMLDAGWTMLVISWRKNSKGRYRWRHTRIEEHMMLCDRPEVLITEIPMKGPRK